MQTKSATPRVERGKRLLALLTMMTPMKTIKQGLRNQKELGSQGVDPGRVSRPKVCEGSEHSTCMYSFFFSSLWIFFEETLKLRQLAQPAVLSKFHAPHAPPTSGPLPSDALYKIEEFGFHALHPVFFALLFTVPIAPKFVTSMNASDSPQSLQESTAASTPVIQKLGAWPLVDVY